MTTQTQTTETNRPPAPCGLDAPATCAACRHWRRRPADPANLTAPRPGECWEGPPQLMAIPTPQGLSLQLVRPMTPAEYPACGRFELKGR